MISQADKKMMRHSKGGFMGKSLIEKIELQMDKTRSKMEGNILAIGIQAVQDNPIYMRNKGRYEGLGAALSILRSSSLKEEIDRSDERLGIE